MFPEALLFTVILTCLLEKLWRTLALSLWFVDAKKSQNTLGIKS